MEFLTLHQLAHEFNKPERQIRYRFRELIKEGKLAEGDDFRKEDFVDEFHFAYKVNALRFMEEAKLVLDQQAVANIVSKTEELGSQLASKEEGLDTNEGDQPEPIGSEVPEAGYPSASKDSASVSKLASKPSDPGSKFVTNQESVADKPVLLDYIETMKQQLRVKDDQIESYRQQLDDQSGVTRAAITELLKMKDQVLRLRGDSRREKEQEQAWSTPPSDQDDGAPEEGSIHEVNQTHE